MFLMNVENGLLFQEGFYVQFWDRSIELFCIFCQQIPYHLLQ